MKLIVFLLLFPLTLAANPARRVIVKKDEVVTVKTALGIATIIQVPDQPTSVVLGDSAAFKVEYLDQAITIKPLHRNATSNLYIHTNYDRYSVKLVTGAQAVADYVVYLSPYSVPNPKTDQAANKTLRWKTIGVSKKTSIGQITLLRIAKTSSAILIEMEISPDKNRRLDPGVFWLKQGFENRPIQDLLLSSLDAKKNQSVIVTLIIRKIDLKQNFPAVVEVKSSGITKFTLAKEWLWKD